MNKILNKLFLKRIASEPEGTFGVLLQDRLPFAVTMELPWRNNQRDISCIPEGLYTCKLVFSPSFKGTYFQIMDVPGRGNILLHKGNVLANTLGCVLVGESFDPILGVQNGITSSKKGYNEFMSRYETQNMFDLEIWDPADFHHF